MTPTKTLLAACACFGLVACNDPALQEQIGTGVASGAIGAIAAGALGANAGWTTAAGLAAGTAGALYARNRQSGQCAYYTGNTLPNGEQEVVLRPCA